jgi:beta-phosphoglucomutase-like phosphatase (HAD superfamily)
VDDWHSRLKGRAMCEQCVEIDKKIENCQRLASRITDQPTIDGIKGLIEQLQAQKVALHPEQKK